MELGAGIAKALLACAKSTEILGGLGDNVIIEGEVDAAGLVSKGVSSVVNELIEAFDCEERLCGSCLGALVGQISHTFDLFGSLSVVQDRALPGNVEICFDGHVRS